MTLTPFDETLTAERTPLFTLTSLHPLSDLRNVVTGSPVHNTDEYQLEAGDKIETAEIGRYIPGYSAEAGIGVRISTLPTGSQVMRWGLYDDEDGFFFELDATTLYAVTRRASTDTKVTQANWSVDEMDGSGPSKFDLDLSQGNIFQIRFTWYGYGQVNWQVVDTARSAPHPQRIIEGHRSTPSGATSVRNPNLPITAEVTGAGDGVLHLAGRQYSILGRYEPQLRTHATTRTVTGVGTSWTPILAFRRQNTANAKRIKLRVHGMTVVVSANTQVALVENPTVTFGTAIAPDLATLALSAVEFSVNPSSYSLGSGEPLVTDLVTASGTGSNTSGSGSWPGLNLPVARTRPIVLIARALSGTSDVTALLRSLEEW